MRPPAGPGGRKSCRGDQHARSDVLPDGVPRRYGAGVDLVPWARAYAEELLAELGNRWGHSDSVGQRARTVARIAGEDGELLIAAAYLHDVGYSPRLNRLGFHPVDGARHLRELGHERLARLVAHHSSARSEAARRGLSAELADFPVEDPVLADALTYCDLTTGPAGQYFTLTERLAEVEARYGGGHDVVVSVRAAEPRLREAVARTEARLAAHPLDPLDL